MKWHAELTQHANQFGFAVTVCFLDPAAAPELPFECSTCGESVPQCLFEVTLLVWTLIIVTHAVTEKE